MANGAGGAITWGVLPDGCLDRVVVCSPHFDDAALGAAHLLTAHPDSTVVTVFGGRPASYPDPPTEWDALGGFRAGDDVVALRRLEDRAAMEVLGAAPIWLDFVDHQYLAPDERAEPHEIAVALDAVLEEAQPTAVFLPMGLANPDHVATHDAGVLLAAGRDDLTWFCYEDSGYKHIPGMLAWRIAKLFRSDLWPTPMVVPVMLDNDRKRAAIECYRSQLPPLNRDHALGARIGGSVPEQFWLLAPPPPGWELMREM
ncbi:MAG TPA: PIG-L family deacetylase [Acidimicrobiia bacterium]|nr:PIG-L family deacetylase [Acidimicrobiia bacterium]